MRRSPGGKSLDPGAAGMKSNSVDEIPYKVIRRKRRTASIIVRPDASVEVHVPLRLAEKHVRDIVLQKRTWIVRKRREAAEQLKNFPPRSYRSGETFWVFGRKVVLKISEGKSRPPVLRGSTLEIVAPPGRKVDLRKRVLGFYQGIALTTIEERVRFFASRLGLRPGIIRVRNMKSRWGSCSSTGALTLNTRLAMAPLSVIDYVVVHELCHLKEPNHSPSFWNLVEGALPGFRKEKAWLRNHGRSIEL